MKSINEYFDAIFCINLPRSPDRLDHAYAEAAKHNFVFERFQGYDFKDYDGLPDHLRAAMANAMGGCTGSHGALLAHIAHMGYKRALILEDDFRILRADFTERFSFLVEQLPADWDLFYLGAHYGDIADPEMTRVNEHIVRAWYVKTTSSYAVTAKHARVLAPFLHGCSGPDDLISGFNPHAKAYVFNPRLMGQFENVSTIWGKLTNNTLCMTEPSHDKAINELRIAP